MFVKFINLIKSPYFLCIWLILATLSYFFIDQRLALFFNSHPANNFYTIESFLSEFGRSTYYIISFAVLFLLGKFIFKNKKLAKISLFFLLAVVVSGIVCVALKVLLGRARPTMFIHHNLFGFYWLQFKANMWSLPSGHSVTITAIMMSLSLLYPRFWLGFLSFAFLVAFGRVVIGAHYLSDIMIGMYLGAIVVIWLNSVIKLDRYISRGYTQR